MPICNEGQWEFKGQPIIKHLQSPITHYEYLEPHCILLCCRIELKKKKLEHRWLGKHHRIILTGREKRRNEQIFAHLLFDSIGNREWVDEWFFMQGCFKASVKTWSTPLKSISMTHFKFSITKKMLEWLQYSIGHRTRIRVGFQQLRASN